jgi:hypothetical protein
MKTAEQIIREHYGKKEPLSLGQVMDELANLRRRHAKEFLDDFDQALYSRLARCGYLKD